MIRFESLVLGLDIGFRINLIRIAIDDKNYFLLGRSQYALLHLEQATGLGLFSLGNQIFPHWLQTHASTCLCPIIIYEGNTSIYFLLFTYIHTKGINNGITNGITCN